MRFALICCFQVCMDNKCTDLTTNKIIEKEQRWSEFYDYKVKYNYPCQFQCMITYKTYQDVCSKTLVKYILLLFYSFNVYLLKKLTKTCVQKR